MGAYPILAWAVENAARKYSDTDQASRLLRPLFTSTVQTAMLVRELAKRLSGQKRLAQQMASSSPYLDGLTIHSGERNTALQFITEWFENNLGDYLKVCDPYFGTDDLEMLKLVMATKPTCRIQILTSEEHQRNLPLPLKQTYRNHWRQKWSDQNPPNTQIVVVGIRSNGKSPIHDRWWISNGSGLRVGTSFNSLGVKRTSEISIFSKEEALAKEEEIDRYLDNRICAYGDDQLEYDIFNL
jgi:hypothetical protein